LSAYQTAVNIQQQQAAAVAHRRVAETGTGGCFIHNNGGIAIPVVLITDVLIRSGVTTAYRLLSVVVTME